MSSVAPPGAFSVTNVLTEALHHLNAGRLDAARTASRTVLKIQPGNVDALHILGVTEIRAGNFDAATKALAQAVKAKPDLVEAHINLAHAWGEKREWRKRGASLQAALKFWPDRADLMSDVGLCWEKLGKSDDALDWYRRALSADPGCVPAHVGTGKITTERGDYETADRSLMEALAVAPANPVALANLAIVRDAQGRMDEVVPLLDRAIAADPGLVDAQYHRVLALLTRGRFAEAWPDYHIRFRRPENITQFGRHDLPYWRGEPLEGRRILVWTEQGPGDEILMGTMIGEVLARARQSMILCSPRLVPLFRRTFPSAEICSYDDGPKTVARFAPEFQISLSDLGQALRPDFASFAASRPYLKADDGRTQMLREKYAADAGGKKLVGLAWHSANAGAHAFKSMTLDDLAPLLKADSVRFVSLQYGDLREQLARARAAGFDILDDRTINPLKDMDAFAAQVAALDAVVSVSNTTVHVAGALGKPCWAFIPASYGRLWYWFLDRPDCPWYPSVTLHRQRRGERWDATVTRAAKHFSSWLHL